MEIIGAKLDSLAEAANVRVIGRFFSSMLRPSPGSSDPTDLIAPGKNALRWIDSESVALLWEDANRTRQVYRLHVPTGSRTQLTFHPTNVVSYECHKAAMVYAARAAYVDNVSAERIRNGYVVQNLDAYSLARGWLDGAGRLARDLDCQWYLKRESANAVPMDVNGLGKNLHGAWGSLIASFSPDGRSILLTSTPNSIPRSWDGYSPSGGFMNEFLAASIKEYRKKGWNGFTSRQMLQLFLLDIQSGRSTPVMDAPYPTTRAKLMVWSPNGSSFLYGPTYLPVSDGIESGIAGSALVEVDRQSLRRTLIPIPRDLRISNYGRQFARLRWITNDEIEVGDGTRELYYRKEGGTWSQAGASDKFRHDASHKVKVYVREDRDTPPVYVAQDNANGQEFVIHDPNPNLKDIALSRVQEMEWADSRGNAWSGRLYLPLRYAAGRRYPLVIQPYIGADKQEFSLTGVGGNFPRLGPGWSIFLAQALAARDILVLQTRWMTNYSRPTEADTYVDGFECAIRHLDARGMIDPNRIGLSGYSLTGWYVMHALTRSAIVFASAVVSDFTTGDYLTATLDPSLIGDYSAAYGGEPFGENLKGWLDHSPSFNVQRIYTPLRISDESQSGVGLIGCWEIFARLREIQRPVEYYVAPDVERGAHTLQNPRQLLAVQNGALDWHDFWLNSREDRVHEKAEQYARWRELRRQRDEVFKTPRPPPLEWSVRRKSDG